MDWVPLLETLLVYHCDKYRTKGKEAAADVYDQAAAVVDEAYEAASGRIKDEASA